MFTMGPVATKVEDTTRLLIVNPSIIYVLGKIMTVYFHSIMISIQPMSKFDQKVCYSQRNG